MFSPSKTKIHPYENGVQLVGVENKALPKILDYNQRDRHGMFSGISRDGHLIWMGVTQSLSRALDTRTAVFILPALSLRPPVGSLTWLQRFKI